MALGLGLAAMGYDEPPGLLERFLARMGVELDRQPDYVCTQQIDRFARLGERPWQKQDSLTFQVAFIGGLEYYSLPGERRFRQRPLAELAGRGTISTGQFALLASHVFARQAARIVYRGESERGGRRAHEYEYTVPAEKSSYRLRMGTEEAVVGFQGTFHVDAETADLLEFDVQACDIPDRIGLTQADTQLTYSRLPVGEAAVLLPTAATLTMVAADGLENLNRARLSECRRFTVESLIRFEGVEAARPVPEAPVEAASLAETVVELALESDLNPAAVRPGDQVRARLARPAGRDGKALLPSGAIFLGSVVRLQKETAPFPIYEIGLEFGSVETGGVSMPITATMVDVERAPGILSQARRLDPKFTPHSKPRLDVLVREVQRGQGILLWDARRGSIPRGLRMKWRVQDAASQRARR